MVERLGVGTPERGKNIGREHLLEVLGALGPVPRDAPTAGLASFGSIVRAIDDALPDML